MLQRIIIPFLLLNFVSAVSLSWYYAIFHVKAANACNFTSEALKLQLNNCYVLDT